MLKLCLGLETPLLYHMFDPQRRWSEGSREQEANFFIEHIAQSYLSFPHLLPVCFIASIAVDFLQEQHIGVF